MPKIMEKLKLKSPSDVATRLERLREEEREFSRQHGRLAEDAHERLDAAARRWNEQLRSLIESGIPEHVTHPHAQTLAVLLALTGGTEKLHTVIDQLTTEGLLDATPRAEIDKKLAEFAKERRALQLVAQEQAVEEAEAQAKRQREALDAQMAEIV